MNKFRFDKFFIKTEENKKLEAKIPFTLYSLCEENGLLSDSVYKSGFLYDDAKFLKECEIESKILLDGSVANSKSVQLRLSGIYAKSELVFNGKSFGILDNVNKTFLFDITDDVKSGENTLTLKCIEPLAEACSIKECEDSLYEASISRPQLSDMGIVGDCEILAYNTAMIKDVHISQNTDSDKAEVYAHVDIMGCYENSRVILTLTSPIGQVFFGSVINGVGKVTVPSPMLWWPSSLGTPSLYTLCATLYYKDEAKDVFETKIGLRSLKFNSDASSPKIAVNGVDVMAMGATFEGVDIVLGKWDNKKIRELVESVRDANMNTIRISETVPYVPKYFYECCDELGIIALLCIAGKYEYDFSTAAFSLDKTEEVSGIISRISSHPCALIAGVSVKLQRNYEGKLSCDAAEEFRIGYSRVVHSVIGRKPCDFFDFADDLIYKNDEYNLSRGGVPFISIPDIKTVRSFAEREKMNILSPKMLAHISDGAKVQNLLYELAGEQRYALGIEELAYSSEYEAAECARRSVEAVRCKRDFCGTAVYRRYNDEWPSVSSSFVDYFGRKKALYYKAKEFFSPILLSAQPKGERGVAFYVCNDTQKDFSGEIRYSLYDTADYCVTENAVPAKVLAMSSQDVTELDFSSHMTKPLSEYYLVYELFDDKGKKFSGSKIFVKPREFDFKNPAIRARVFGSGKSFEITLASDAYARGVRISFSDIDAELSDNYFDMTVDEVKKISVTTKEVMAKEVLERGLSIMTVYDIGREKARQISFFV